MKRLAICYIDSPDATGGALVGSSPKKLQAPKLKHEAL